MSLTSGTRLGAYQITGLIGVGGMGEVYRASDTKLGRDVAIKTLPSELAKDPDRLARFEREAKLLAALNHAHIASVYSLDEHDGALYLAMELVDGETLDRKLARGPLPLDEALRLALQIAEALEAAHEKGVVHRDLKPANIMVNGDGQVKVLDFGLAKVFATDPKQTVVGHSPALSLAMTQQGLVLGTAGYMSPEQASGQATDQRADIWAFGVVLYELLTGKPVFTGESVPHILADVLRTEPDWNRLPKNLHPRLKFLLERCLAKKPRNRLHSIADARVEIESVLSDPRGVTPRTDTHVEGARVAWLVAGVTGVLCAALAVPATLYFRRTPAELPEIRFEMAAPGETRDLTISPNGQRIAYVASIDGHTQVWIRPLGALAAQPLAGTDNAGGLFWSPDSRNLGFVADGKLRKIAIAGGPAQALADAPFPLPGAWSRADAILFSPVPAAGGLTVSRISAAGGAVTQVTMPDAGKAQSDLLPRFLPDGRHFLFVRVSLTSPQAAPSVSTLFVGSLDSADTAVVAPIDSQDRRDLGYGFAANSLLFTRNGTLLAQRFDAEALAPRGDPRPVAENVGEFSLSETGVLVYREGVPADVAGKPLRRLVWRDRKGQRVGEVEAPRAYRLPALSPDGRQVAVAAPSSDSLLADIWTVDTERGVAARLTFDPANDQFPVWSPDGARIVFGSGRGSTQTAVPNRLYQRAANGTGADELLFAGDVDEVVAPWSWSADGRYIFFFRGQTTGIARLDVWALPMTGDKTPFPVLQSPFRKGGARLSPDGRWIAYSTDESGSSQIVVQAFPNIDQGKWRVSSRGGWEPRWRRDGRELFFLSPEGTVMAVEVKAGDTFEFGRANALFETGLDPTPERLDPDTFYDVTADGQRFLINEPAPTASTTSANAEPRRPINVIVNWAGPRGE